VKKPNRSNKAVSCSGGRIRPPAILTLNKAKGRCAWNCQTSLGFLVRNAALRNADECVRGYTSLSFAELAIPFQHMPLRHDTFQLPEIRTVHDRHQRPPVHIPQSRFQRMIGMQEWNGCNR